ncbi:response regulator [Halorubrum lipolyticum]|uniref:Light and oxygen sensing histidine kinase n=1 Tax=Halorubrum lipolyticum DSM 21995 TaxID=1227482 RepID=M0NLY1_9EURY|nr:response regulator [Halorubrum lipolyticum]EMA58573.1 light and oxygen sensing histidine kinase [Halorubrum lipolyticum DSM 21995]
MTDHNPSTPPTQPETAEPRQSTDAVTATESAAAGAGSVDGEPGRIDVLHVDPDPRSAELLATFAAHAADPISVRSVGRAEAALAAIDGTDCVVTEQRLPDGSGVALVDRLRGDGETLPVVFHTTHRDERVEARAFGVGADAYFEKRSSRGQYERILDCVRSLVETRDSRRFGPAEPPSVDDPPGASETIRSEE